VRNLATTPSRFTAYYTSFDNQSLPLGSKGPVIRNTGDTWDETFGKTCIQVDLTYGNPGDAPFLAGYIDDKGNVVGRITDEIRKACTPVVPPCRGEQCYPTPNPSPTPTPQPSPTPTPAPQYCYYEVDCGNQLKSFLTVTTACPDTTKKALCEQKNGEWAKWISQGKEHCRIALPGVSLGNFQLTPGQSAPGCLSKHDID
jgi:hypothetical protein